MEDLWPGPATFLGRRAPAPRSAPRGPRPYPECDEDATAADVALAALRALVHAPDPGSVRAVLATAVGDLGGTIVPARFEPAGALGIDVSLGLGDPAVVVVDPLSVAAMGLREALPGLLADARAVLDRMQRESVLGLVGDAEPEPRDLTEYLALLSRGDVAGARRWALRLLQRGVSPVALVEQVLVPAQQEVGERWYRGAWSVADEHAASAVTDTCLGVLPVVHEGPSVVLTAPEGEWHALPARMAAATARGARTRVLGPGVPTDQLQRYLATHEPDLLAVSCTMATSLLSAARTVAAAQEVGVPALLGGRALGDDPRRARALGADGWSSSASTLGSEVPVPRAPSPEPSYEAQLADAVHDGTLLLALERQAGASSWVRARSEQQQGAALDELREVTRTAAAALACDDPTVLDELVSWLGPLMQRDEVPAHVLPDGLGYLAEALEAETPAVAALVSQAADRLR